MSFFTLSGNHAPREFAKIRECALSIVLWGVHGFPGTLQWKIVDFLLILVNIAANYWSGADSFFRVDHSEAAGRKYVVFWGVATFFLRKILYYNQQKSGISRYFQTMSGQDPLRIWLTMLIAAGILRSRTRNCDRDLTRFPKGISLMTFQLSLFRGNQEFWGFAGKYWNIRETRFSVENDEKIWILAFLRSFRHSDELPTRLILPSSQKSLSSKLFNYVVFWGSGITNLQRLPSGKTGL